jgi:oligopeptide/dipeptide ABC transporter ATP-binding protein
VSALLTISDLSVAFDSDAGTIKAVDHINLEIRSREVMGLVGESGSGKSVTTLAILRLIRRPGRITSGTVRFDGVDLATLTEDQMSHIRGARIAMIPQTPRTALNPVIPVGSQIARLFMLHGGLARKDAEQRTLEMLSTVRIPDPARRAQQYAHQLSGGMCQRVMIAMALATSPQLLLADEPTTGLDASIAVRILDLLREMGEKTGAAILFITHDLGVVAEICDHVTVMHAGQVVESAPVRTIFHAPAHPYTCALIRSIPRLDREIAMEPIPGSVPSLVAPPPGCRYIERCALAIEPCRLSRPPLDAIAPDHLLACYGYARAPA